MTNQEALDVLIDSKLCRNSAHEWVANIAIDVLQELVDKAKPEKVEFIGDGYYGGKLVYDTWICPRCGKHYEVDYDVYDYCPNCGQALDLSNDWSEDE